MSKNGEGRVLEGSSRKRGHQNPQKIGNLGGRPRFRHAQVVIMRFAPLSSWRAMPRSQQKRGKGKVFETTQEFGAGVGRVWNVGRLWFWNVLDIYCDLGLSENLDWSIITFPIRLQFCGCPMVHPHELHQDIHAWVNMGMIWHDMDGPWPFVHRQIPGKMLWAHSGKLLGAIHCSRAWPLLAASNHDERALSHTPGSDMVAAGWKNGQVASDGFIYTPQLRYGITWAHSTHGFPDWMILATQTL